MLTSLPLADSWKSQWKNLQDNLKALRQKNHTVETRTKEPVFIRTLKLNFDLLSLLNKNIKAAETGSGSYMTGFIVWNLRI